MVMGVLPESVWSVLAVRAAVEETVETREGGGEGEDEREAGEAGEGGGGEAEMVVRLVTFPAFLAGRERVESAVPGVEQMTPEAFIVSR